MLRGRSPVGLLAIAGISMIGSGVALAATSGQQQLQLTASLRPARAGTRDVALKIAISYTNPKNQQQQPPYNTKQLIFSGPFQVKPSAVPACPTSAVIKAGGKSSGCPRDTMVGHGTVLINAYPTLKKPVSGTATAYNGVTDKSYAGYPKGSPVIFLYVKTTIGVNTTDEFYIHTDRAGSKFTAYVTKPKQPGVQPGSYSIKKLSLSVAGGTAHKPYLSDPSSCSGHWLFSFTIENFFNQPSVTAHSREPCQK